jgi:hypothetical protein
MSKTDNRPSHLGTLKGVGGILRSFLSQYDLGARPIRISTNHSWQQ